MECGCCNTCVSFRAGVPEAPLCLGCEELELREEKVLDGAAGSVRECPGAPGEARALLRLLEPC